MEILNIKESAKYLNCSVSSIRKIIRGKEIEFFRIGSKIYVLKEDIDRWIEMCKMKNAKEESSELKISSMYDKK